MLPHANRGQGVGTGGNTRCGENAGEGRDAFAPNIGTRIFNIDSGISLIDDNAVGGTILIDPNTTPVLGYGVTANRFLRVDIAPNETTFFESTYPIVMTDRDSLTVEVSAPDAGGTGIGSAVNFIVNGDTDV